MLRLLTCLCCTLLLATSAGAETHRWQEYDIHYTALRSTLIPAEVALAHGITRSDTRLIINVSIRTGDAPVSARVAGTATNLLNQQFILTFSEVSEEGAIYYLASQVTDERDTLRFDISVSPAGTGSTHQFAFTRSFQGRTP